MRCPNCCLYNLGLGKTCIPNSLPTLSSHFSHFPPRIIASWAEYWWGWDVVDHWMMTGEYEWKLPVWGTYIKEKDPRGKPPCDWWGVNYYSRPVLNWHLSTTCFPVRGSET